MNPDLDKLLPYPFERLARLLANTRPDDRYPLISLAVGEPQHEVPALIIDALRQGLGDIAHYPITRGGNELREAIAAWLTARFELPDLCPATQALPVNGTREALFAFAQAVVARKPGARVGMPNPGYQIYEGAALLAGAEPLYLDCREENDFLPDLDAVPAKTWEHVQLLYLCTPGNPTGAVMSEAELAAAIQLADKHDFIIASDECYSEIYPDEENPPAGLLQAAASIGNSEYRRCVTFHSLSKRSNVPGMRSGFVAGDADVLKKFLLYRTYHGCAMNPAVQHASVAAWGDETHVKRNRKLYREKFRAVLEILSPVMEARPPDASFYLWPKVSDGDDEACARRLWQDAHLRCLPGSYLGRDTGSGNPGAGRLRLSLVPSVQDCVAAAQRIADLSGN